MMPILVLDPRCPAISKFVGNDTLFQSLNLLTPSFLPNSIARWQQEIPYQNSVEYALKTFPYLDILQIYQTCGKHFVSQDLLNDLANLQVQIEQYSDLHDNADYRLILAFFEMLLDKHTGKYNYVSYTGSHILEHLSIEAELSFDEHLLTRISHLILVFSDIIYFESRTLLNLEVRFPKDLADVECLNRRIYFALMAIDEYRSLVPTLLLPANYADIIRLWNKHKASLGELPAWVYESTLILVNFIQNQFTERIRLIHDLIMMPVSRSHDEYMFIRILQSFEMIFSIIVKGFLTCIDYLEQQKFALAAQLIQQLQEVFHRNPSLFRILNTMPKEHFAIFRTYTDGASAIQSRQYKHFEILASHPVQHRMQSAAFDSVPHIKQLYNLSPCNLEDIMRYYLEMPTVCATPAFQLLVQRLQEFDTAFVCWKQMHFRIACKMLGRKRGTGGTSGTPYLEYYLNAKLFPFLRATK